MKNISLIIGILLFSASIGSAQQDPMFTQYMFNTLSINPAYAGSADVTTLNAIYRHQWAKLDGAPVTQSFTGHGRLLGQSIGVGGTVLNDQHGPVRQTGAYADVSYIFDVTDKTRLSFGVKGGINFYQANLLELNPMTSGDPTFGENISNKGLPNFGAGALLYNKNFYVGLSVPKIIHNKLITADLPDFENNEEKTHFFFIAGFVKELTSYMHFKPTFLVKSVAGAPISYDISANFLFYERFWIGGMYRKTDAIGVLLQYEVNRKVKVGYAYDYILSDLSSYSSGSHEVMLSFDFLKKESGDTSPRYF